MPDGASPGKCAVSLAIDEELVKAAEASGLNLAALLEAAVQDRLKADRWRAWQAENRSAIESMNEYVAKNGLPLEKYRTW